MLRQLRHRVLENVGTHYQDITYLGHGDFEYGERVWLVGSKSFSFDDPPVNKRDLVFELFSVMLAWLESVLLAVKPSVTVAVT